jgi:hypothetical protein
VEQRFFFGLLMWGEGTITPHYLIFCFLGSLGALQFVAGKYRRRDLTPFPFHFARWGGAALVGLAFLWFFTVEPDIYIPGLAGGEFVVFALSGFASAVLSCKGAAALARRWLPERSEQVIRIPGENSRE